MDSENLTENQMEALQNLSGSGYSVDYIGELFLAVMGGDAGIIMLINSHEFDKALRALKGEEMTKPCANENCDEVLLIDSDEVLCSGCDFHVSMKNSGY